MNKRDQYLDSISKRGDRYGDSGGLNSLLSWCGKDSLREVSEAEARAFLKDPAAPYPPEDPSPAAEDAQRGRPSETE